MAASDSDFRQKTVELIRSLKEVIDIQSSELAAVNGRLAVVEANQAAELVAANGRLAVLESKLTQKTAGVRIVCVSAIDRVYCRYLQLSIRAGPAVYCAARQR